MGCISFAVLVAGRSKTRIKQISERVQYRMRSDLIQNDLTFKIFRFCSNLGWLYTRLVASNSFSPEYRQGEDEARRGSIRSSRRIQPTRLSNSIQEFMAMWGFVCFIGMGLTNTSLYRELHLQIKLIELQSLLSQAQHEPRLKGPFPVGLYRHVLTSLQTILDKLHSMRCVTTREEWLVLKLC